MTLPPDVLNPLSLILPNVTTAVRRSMAAEIGTILFDTDLSKICFSKSATVATASWELVTSVQDA
jgi:hypothetical protein